MKEGQWEKRTWGGSVGCRKNLMFILRTMGNYQRILTGKAGARVQVGAKETETRIAEWGSGRIVEILRKRLC